MDKAAKTDAILTERIGGRPRIRLTSPLAKLAHGARFAVDGEGDSYVVTRYRRDDYGTLVETCSCPATRTCYHILAARQWMSVMPEWQEKGEKA